MYEITDGKSLNAALKALGISRRQLAAQAGCAGNTCYRWCSGDLPVPQYVRTIVQLNQLLLGRLATERGLVLHRLAEIDNAIRQIQRGDGVDSEEDPPLQNAADMAA